MQLQELNSLQWLVQWYIEHCNSTQDNSVRIKINTIDNPGWDVYINIREVLSSEAEIIYNSDIWNDDDWYGYTIKDGIFNGYGDTNKLDIIILSFKQLWEQFTHQEKPHKRASEYKNSNILQWLTRWYKERCNGEWEHAYSIHMRALHDCKWELIIRITGTPIERITSHVEVTTTEYDWYHYKIIDSDSNGREFIGYGDPTKLPVLIKCFQNLWEQHTEVIS